MSLGIWFCLLIINVLNVFLCALLVRIRFSSAVNTSGMLLFLAVHLSLVEDVVSNVFIYSGLTLNHR